MAQGAGGQWRAGIQAGGGDAEATCMHMRKHKTQRDFEKETECESREASGDQTPRWGGGEWTAHEPTPAGQPANTPLPVNPHASGGWVPTYRVRRGKHLGQKEPEGPDTGMPSDDHQATVRAGPHLWSGAKGEANAPEGGPGGVWTDKLESRRSEQGRPSPCPLRQPGPGRVQPVHLRSHKGMGRCWLTQSGHPRAQTRSTAMITLPPYPIDSG